MVENGSLGQIIGYVFSLAWLTESIRLTLNYITAYFADFGYHPYKSFIYIGFFVLAFYLLITRWLQVTHLNSEERNERLPLNAYFLLDLMIPIYSINPAYKKISAYYFADGKEIDSSTEQKLQTILTILRMIGIVAAVFLTASLKALVLG